MIRRAPIVVLALLLTACATYPVNPQLGRADITKGYRYSNLSLPREDGLFVILTFSGGGSRAAGFAYGVLREMEKKTLPDGSNLLDHIDVISSVSGGSFTSMYFGLHGREGLDAFKTNFLDKNIEGMLVKAAFLNPRNWFRLLSPTFNRIDLAAEVYDRELFLNKTYADLMAVQAAKRRPFIIANSTELDLGARFEWTQDQFDPLCSDLTPTHVSRAVAASSAFPGLLTPMIVKNYRTADCSFVQPSWVPLAMRDLQSNPMRHRSAVEMTAYLNPQRPFLHLMDGGIADNIGLRGPVQAMVSSDTWQMDDPARQRSGFTIQGAMNRREIKRLLVIVVNAGTSNDLRYDTKESNPKQVQILGAVSGTPMSNYSFDTMLALQLVSAEIVKNQSLPSECQAAAQATCPQVSIPGANVEPISIYQVPLGFTGITDADLQKKVNEIGTNFDLKPGQLELLESAAKNLLDGSKAYQQFLTDVGAR